MLSHLPKLPQLVKTGSEPRDCESRASALSSCLTGRGSGVQRSGLDAQLCSPGWCDLGQDPKCPLVWVCEALCPGLCLRAFSGMVAVVVITQWDERPHWGGCKDAVHSLTQGAPEASGAPGGCSSHRGLVLLQTQLSTDCVPPPEHTRPSTLRASEVLHVLLLCSVHLDTLSPHRRFRCGHVWARGACSCCHAPEPCGGSAVLLCSTRAHLVVFLGGDAEGGSRDETRRPVAKGRACGTRWHPPLSRVLAQLNHSPTFSGRHSTAPHRGAETTAVCRPRLVLEARSPRPRCWRDAL